MFTDDTIQYEILLSHLFTRDGLPPVHDDLKQRGATVTEDHCHDCGGILYESGNEVVCGNCSLVVDASTPEQEQPTEWEYFQSNRPSYRNSRYKRCVGGFPDAHDWVEREQIDHPVRKLDPSLFYDYSP